MYISAVGYSKKSFCIGVLFILSDSFFLATYLFSVKKFSEKSKTLGSSQSF